MRTRHPALPQHISTAESSELLVAWNYASCDVLAGDHVVLDPGVGPDAGRGFASRPPAQSRFLREGLEHGPRQALAEESGRSRLAGNSCGIPAQGGAGEEHR